MLKHVFHASDNPDFPFMFEGIHYFCSIQNYKKIKVQNIFRRYKSVTYQIPMVSKRQGFSSPEYEHCSSNQAAPGLEQVLDRRELRALCARQSHACQRRYCAAGKEAIWAQLPWTLCRLFACSAKLSRFRCFLASFGTEIKNQLIIY